MSRALFVLSVISVACKGDPAPAASVDPAPTAIPRDAVAPHERDKIQDPRAGNKGAGNAFGEVIALTADGKTLAIGAWSTPSAAIDDGSTDFTGAVYLYAREEDGWRRTTTLLPSYTGAGFGVDLAFASDGNTLAIGARGRSKSEDGLDGVVEGSPTSRTGAVYLYSRAAGAWTEGPRLVGDEHASDLFGHSLALSADGATLVVGAFKQEEGIVFVFARDGDRWSRRGRLAEGTLGDGFGHCLALTRDAATLFVTAPFANASSGVAYVYERRGDAWKRTSRLVGDKPRADYLFGDKLALADDGKHFAISASRKGSGNAGVYVFGLDRSTWKVDGYVEPSGGHDGDEFGSALALSADGRILLVGADHHDELKGAVYRYVRSAAWSEDAVVKVPTPPATFFGMGLAMSGDGAMMQIGAQGAVHVFHRH